MQPLNAFLNENQDTHSHFQLPTPAYENEHESNVGPIKRMNWNEGKIETV